jgi:hypothetical protein
MPRPSKFPVGVTLRIRELSRRGLPTKEIARRLKLRPGPVGRYLSSRRDRSLKIAGTNEWNQMVHRERMTDVLFADMSPRAQRLYLDSVGVVVKPQDPRITRKRRSISQEEEDRRMILYNRGLSDGGIAKTLGLKVRNVAQWRRQRGLQSNYSQFPRLS